MKSGIVVTVWRDTQAGGWFWSALVAGREAGKGHEMTYVRASEAALQSAKEHEQGVLA